MANSFHEPWEIPEMEDIAALSENIVYRLPGVDNIMVRKTLQSVYADFARLSCCFVSWRDIETEEYISEYAVHPMIPGMNVRSVSDVTIDGRKIVNGRDYAIITVGITPVIRLSSNAMSIVPRIISIRTVEQPKYNSESAPRWFIEKYGDAIVAGALVKLHGMTGRPWADQEMMRQETVRYENFCTEARVKSFSDDGSQFGSGSLNPVDMSGVL